MLSSGEGVLKGAWDLRKQKNHAVQLEGILAKVGERGRPKTLGIQHQEWAERSNQQGRRAPELECSEAKGLGGCKARGRKQDFRAKVRTKKKPPNSVPQRSVVSLDEVILTLKGWTGH